MRKNQLIALFMVFFTTFINLRSHAQGFFWTQYEADNPAAAGVNTKLSITSVSGTTGNNWVSERISAQARIKKLHGGVSAGYRYDGWFDNRFRQTNPYANYSFHINTGANSLLAFGVGAEWNRWHYNYSEDDYTENFVHYKAGVHFQYKGFKVGVAASTFQNGNQTRFGLSDIYLDYTKAIGENWTLNASAHLGRYDPGVQLRATYKKYWFGVNYGFYQGAGVMAGMQINDKWSVGYSFNMANLDYGQKLSLSHGLLLRFRLP